MMPNPKVFTLCLITLGLLTAGPLRPVVAKPLEIDVVSMGPYAINRNQQSEGLMVQLTHALLQLAEVNGTIRVLTKAEAINLDSQLLVATDPDTLPAHFVPFLRLTRLEIGILYSQNAHPDNPIGSIDGLEFGIRNQHPLPLQAITSYREGIEMMQANRLSGVLGGVDALINTLIDTNPDMPFMVGDSRCQRVWLFAPASFSASPEGVRLKRASTSEHYRRIEAQLYPLNRQRWPQPCA